MSGSTSNVFAAIGIAVLMVAFVRVLFWLIVKVSRIDAAARDAAAEERQREGAEQSRLFPTYGEDQ